MSNQNILVIAFDGLDYELIQEFALENIKQTEFGLIDNQKDISKTYTSELFASFITGKNYQEHGVKALKKRKQGLRQSLIRILTPEILVSKMRGANRFRKVLEELLGADLQGKKYRKEDLDAPTLFDSIETSRAMFVPSYNPSILWATDSDLRPLDFGYDMKETANFWDTREYRHRKESLFNEIKRIGARPLLMAHFHRPDIYQHLYGDKEVNYDRKKLKELYKDIDELAAEIKETAFDQGYDVIIFMSDHGLPTQESHNENAFYSSNVELFSNKTPHITDFHDEIMIRQNRDSEGSRSK